MVFIGDFGFPFVVAESIECALPVVDLDDCALGDPLKFAYGSD